MHIFAFRVRTDKTRTRAREKLKALPKVRLLMAIALVAAVLLAIGLYNSFTTSPSSKTSGANPVAGHSVTFGMSDPSLLTETASVQMSQLARMKTLGITSVRFDANWASVQPVGPNAFDWAQLDQAVQSALSAGMSVDLIIDGCPSWAALPSARGDEFAQPASSAMYATWAADVVRRYGPKGVRVYEIWNEPNIKAFWRPKPDPSAYTADLRAAYSAIKSIDPAALVVTGGLAPIIPGNYNYSPVNFLKSMYANGAKGYFDSVGYHPYSFPALPNTPAPMSGWSQMGDVYPSLRSVMISHGDAHKSIWITEFGAPSGGPAGVGQITQATELKEGILDAKATAWIGALYIYTWQDSGVDQPAGHNWFGLLTAQGAEKPAYSQVAKAIGRH
jgi:polysaccharide biosynthesis protein PslG